MRTQPSTAIGRSPFFLRTALLWAGLHGAVAVGLGAFATHAMGDGDAAGWVETGGRYQLVHAAALLALGVGSDRYGDRRWLGLAAAAFVIGPALFAGALYALAFTGLRILGAVAPFGGVGMILGWLAVAGAGIAAWRSGAAARPSATDHGP